MFPPTKPGPGLIGTPPHFYESLIDMLLSASSGREGPCSFCILELGTWVLSKTETQALRDLRQGRSSEASPGPAEPLTLSPHQLLTDGIWHGGLGLMSINISLG